MIIFAPRFGAIAQLVEQRTENPCVPGSNPGGTTEEKPIQIEWVFLFNDRFVEIGILE